MNSIWVNESLSFGRPSIDISIADDMANNSTKKFGENSDDEDLGGGVNDEVTWTNIQLAVLMLIGCFGNIVLLVLFIRRIRSLKSSIFSYMMCSLAVGDLLTLVIYIPFFMANRYIFTEWVCKLWTFSGVYMLAYVHLMICISVPAERFVTISKPLEKLRIRHAFILVGCSAVAAVPVALPYSLLSNSQTRASGIVTGCPYVYETYYDHAWMRLLTLGVGSAIVLVALVLYTALFVKLLIFKRELAQTNGMNQFDPPGFAEFPTHVRTVVMLLCVALVYMICWLPYYLAALGVIRYDNRYATLFFVGNATNFVIYALLNKSIRTEMLEAVCCRFHRSLN